MYICVCVFTYSNVIHASNFACALHSPTMRSIPIVHLLCKICGVFSETASFKCYGVICLPMASYSNIAVVFYATFQRQSFLKLLKRLTVS